MKQEIFSYRYFELSAEEDKIMNDFYELMLEFNRDKNLPAAIRSQVTNLICGMDNFYDNLLGSDNYFDIE